MILDFVILLLLVLKMSEYHSINRYEFLGDDKQLIPHNSALRDFGIFLRDVIELKSREIGRSNITNLDGFYEQLHVHNVVFEYTLLLSLFGNTFFQ